MKDLPPTARALAAVLAAVGEARVAMPESVAEDLGVTHRSLANAMARLEHDGIIIWHRKSRGGHRDPHHRIEILDADGLAKAAAGAEVHAVSRQHDGADDLEGHTRIVVLRSQEVS